MCGIIHKKYGFSSVDVNYRHIVCNLALMTQTTLTHAGHHVTTNSKWYLAWILWHTIMLFCPVCHLPPHTLISRQVQTRTSKAAIPTQEQWLLDTCSFRTRYITSCLTCIDLHHQTIPVYQAVIFALVIHWNDNVPHLPNVQYWETYILETVCCYGKSI